MLSNRSQQSQSTDEGSGYHGDARGHEQPDDQEGGGEFGDDTNGIAKGHGYEFLGGHVGGSSRKRASSCLRRAGGVR